jgi:cytochrome c2
MKYVKVTFTGILLTVLCHGHAEPQEEPRNKPRGDDWSAVEYSGSRTPESLRIALASKGFAWLSGSPADNEKLSVGKNAQFFGFVSLRYQSGRAANRGAIGRAFFAIADEKQREIMRQAVVAEADDLTMWWNNREKILRILEHHLYTGDAFDENAALSLGAEFSKLNAIIAIHEARAFAALENSLTEEQSVHIRSWRKNPEKARAWSQKIRVTADGLERGQNKQLEDLYAKAFSWLTGTAKDNEIIPLGQPAQFFGFVSIRHKSGHAASRGKIAKSFLSLLEPSQRAMIDDAVRIQEPVVRRFLELRHQFLNQLATLRVKPVDFDQKRTLELSKEMGRLEIKAALVEAQAYRKIRESMTKEQTAGMMKERGNYIIDKAQIELLTHEQRGAQLAVLCAGCHGTPKQHQPNMLGPSLDGIFDRPIASADGFVYSDSLKKSGQGKEWTAALMDQFLADPKGFAPGTKMEFQGLLNEADRKALIDYLKQTR